MIALLLELAGNTLGGFGRVSFTIFAVSAALFWAVMFNSVNA